MNILKKGSQGAEVELLQLALNRAGYGPLDVDGKFGKNTHLELMTFQRDNSLPVDGFADVLTHTALTPWYMGYESKDRETIVSLDFPVVPTDISYSSELINYCVMGLGARYPFLRTGEIGRSVMGKPIWYIGFGEGTHRVLYNASHHANEWITTPVLLRFIEELSEAYVRGEKIYGVDAAEIFFRSSLYIVPAVNPDGIDLVTGVLTSGSYYDKAKKYSEDYPFLPFPDGWKANISGIDLNLQYPADWERAKEIKFAEGYVSPAPRDYVGTAPLSAPESRAMFEFTKKIDPALTLAYHTQGEVIYWRFLDYDPPQSSEIASVFAKVSGYALEDTPYSSGFAGYKDWFIKDYNLPGYTIEAGLGVNPLPISQFGKIYNDNIGILTLGAHPF